MRQSRPLPIGADPPGPRLCIHGPPGARRAAASRDLAAALGRRAHEAKAARSWMGRRQAGSETRSCGAPWPAVSKKLSLTNPLALLALAGVFVLDLIDQTRTSAGSRLVSRSAPSLGYHSSRDAELGSDGARRRNRSTITCARSHRVAHASACSSLAPNRTCVSSARSDDSQHRSQRS